MPSPYSMRKTIKQVQTTASPRCPSIFAGNRETQGDDVIPLWLFWFRGRRWDGFDHRLIATRPILSSSLDRHANSATILVAAIWDRVLQDEDRPRDGIESPNAHLPEIYILPSIPVPNRWRYPHLFSHHPANSSSFLFYHGLASLLLNSLITTCTHSLNTLPTQQTAKMVRLTIAALLTCTQYPLMSPPSPPPSPF
jgi:hypothetical protein